MTTTRTDKLTVVYLDPNTGRQRTEQVRGDYDRVLATWCKGRLVDLQMGWQS